MQTWRWKPLGGKPSEPPGLLPIHGVSVAAWPMECECCGWPELTKKKTTIPSGKQWDFNGILW